MSFLEKVVLIVSLGIILNSGSISVAEESTIINYGVGESFAIIAESGVTTYGDNVILGDVGTLNINAPKPVIMGNFKGEIKTYSDETSKAMTSFSKLVDKISEISKKTRISGNIGEQIFAPGMYEGEDIIVQGTLILDANVNSDKEFIFKVNSLEFAKSSKIELINGAKAENVVFIVKSNTKINNYASIKGTIICYKDIEMMNNSSLTGRLISMGGSVTVSIASITCPPPKANYEPIYKKEIRMEIGTSNVHVNGEKTVMDIATVIKEGYTYVPLSFVTTQLDGKATANKNSKGKIESITIEFENVKAILTLGDSKAYVVENGSGRYIQTGGKVYIDNGRTMVPFKMMGDILNARTSYGMTKDDSRVEWVLFQK